MTTHTSGAADLPAIQRYKIGYHSDDWGQRSSTPSGIPDASGSWVRYADHVAALAVGQAVAPAASDTELQEAHRLGFLRAAGWVQRDDLFSDVGSPTYRKDRDHDLSTIRATRPAPPAMDDRAPADSVQEDAARESEYLRGYRQGYEQRDAEVRGALV